jgi:hypothetical protein
MRSSTLRIVAIALTAIGSGGSLGCGTVIGTLVGSRYPDYREVPLSQLDSMPAGTQVRVTTWDGARTTGALRDADPVTVATEDSPTPRRINPQKVSSVERRDGTHWDEGLAIGLAVDLTLVLVGLAVVGAMYGSGPRNLDLGAGSGP